MTEEHIILARQTEGRKIIATKLPSWAENISIIFPTKISLEQCSSEATALYKQSLVSGNSLVDLTGGFGVDCAFLSKNFSSIDYVEQNEELCEIAKHNFNALGLNIRVNNADSVEFLKQMPSVDCIYIDPARRDIKGKKTADLSLCSPNLLEIRDILLNKCNILLIKLSPMFDISSALEVFPECKQVHIVSVKNECKEILLLVKETNKKEADIICCDLTPNSSLLTPNLIANKNEEIGTLISYSAPKAFLYEPNASVMKAGLFKTVAKRYNVQKLHPSTHLYTSDELVEDFLGRSFKIERVTKVQRKEIQDIDKANLSIRNFPGNVADLRKKLKLKDGGDVYIFACTLHDNSKALIVCEKLGVRS